MSTGDETGGDGPAGFEVSLPFYSAQCRASADLYARCEGATDPETLDKIAGTIAGAVLVALSLQATEDKLGEILARANMALPVRLFSIAALSVVPS